MKNLLITLQILFTANCFAQLYVSSNSYLYVKDRVLFVTQDVNLQNNGFLYLRNESQLLQGTTGSSTNRGQGNVSVFQEGTSDNFDYNYWCSPIGNASSSLGNENFGITMTHRPTTLTASTQAIALPYDNNANGTSVPLQIASRWIWKFINSSSYSQWIYAGGNGATISPGQGFTMKGTSGSDPLDIEGNGILNNPGGSGAQRYDFRGKPNDGNINVTVALNNSTLTGNPYPSALNVNAFLLDPTNIACNGNAYYYEQDKTVNSHLVAQYRGGYGTYSPISLISDGVYVAATFNTFNQDGSFNSVGPSSGSTYKRKFAPIGQGFMIFGAATGNVTLKNSHRAYYKKSDVLSDFERSSNNAQAINDTISSPVSHLKINTIFNNEFTRQIALVFLPEATDGVDRGIDAKNMNDDLPTDTYFFLDNSPYLIQGVAFDINKKIMLGLKSQNNATFKFYIAETINFDENQDVFIHDILNNSYHNIKTGNYEITLPTGVYNDRFEVTFTDSTLGNAENTIKDFRITQSNPLETMTVLNPNLFTIQSVALYDITGKQILFSDNLATNQNYTFSTSGMAQGVYILKIKTSDNLQFSQKVIISNLKN